LEQTSQDLIGRNVALRSFLDGSSCEMGMVQLEGDQIRFILVNGQVARRFGRHTAEIEGRTANELGRPEAEQRAWGTLFRRVVDQGISIRTESEMPTPGGMRFLSALAAPLRSSAEGHARV